MPDVTPSLHPGEVRRWVAIEQHKFSIVAAALPPDGGRPEVCRIETTERAIRRFIDKQGGPAGLSVCYEAGPGGFALCAVSGSVAAGVALARTPREKPWTGGGALGITWATGLGLATGSVAFLARSGQQRAAAALVLAAVSLSDGPAGLRAAERARRRTVAAAAHHGEAGRRFEINSDVLRTRVEGALRRDDSLEVAPEIDAILKLSYGARDASSPSASRSSAQDYVDSSWKNMVMTVEPYDNPLDRARTWHTAEIERLTLVLTYELRAAMTAIPVLVPALARSPNPLTGALGLRTAWLAYFGLATTTALAAPWVTARAMDPSASAFRSRLMVIEIAVGAPALVALPTWPIGASVASAVLNLLNRQGKFSWTWKVPLGSAATIGALGVGLSRTRPAPSEIAITLLGGVVAVLVCSSSYGAWWPFSGASLLGTAIAERRGRARADAAAAPGLAAIDGALAAAEEALQTRSDHDGLFRVRAARVGLADGQAAQGKAIGDIVTSAVTKSGAPPPLTAVRVDGSNTVALRVKRANDAQRLSEAITLLITEAAVHGKGELVLRLRTTTRGVELEAENGIAGVQVPDANRIQAPRGGARLGELAKGMRGGVIEPAVGDGRYTTGLWFPVR